MRKRTTLAVVACVAGLFGAVWYSGYSLAMNPSASMPKGVYIVGPARVPKVGEIIAACIPETAQIALYRARDYLPASTRCPSGLPPVLKPVVAGPGDVVALDKAGASVNGARIANSSMFDTDSQGQPIAHLPLGWKVRLGAGQYFILANHAGRSLDSRYYGPVEQRNVIGIARAVLIGK